MGWDGDEFEKDWTKKDKEYRELITNGVNQNIQKRNQNLAEGEEPYAEMKKGDPRISNLIVAALKGSRSAEQEGLNDILSYEEDIDPVVLKNAVVNQFDRLADYEAKELQRTKISSDAATRVTTLQNDLDTYKIDTERSMISSKAFRNTMPLPTK